MGFKIFDWLRRGARGDRGGFVRLRDLLRLRVCLNYEDVSLDRNADMGGEDGVFGSSRLRVSLRLRPGDRVAFCDFRVQSHERYLVELTWLSS